MITNERQYKISLNKLEEFKSAMADVAAGNVDESVSDPMFAAAHESSLRSFIEEIQEEIVAYEEIRDLDPAQIRASSISDIPLSLIKARIASGLSHKKLGEMIGVKEQQIQRYEAERYRGAKLERLVELSKALGVEISGPTFAEKIEITPEKFPLAEMFYRGYFSSFRGGVEQMKENAEELIFDLFASTGLMDNAVALHRKTTTVAAIDEFSLLAWQARVMFLANFQPMPVEFDADKLSVEWIQELVALSANEDGPLQAVDHLLEAGIHFIYEPHLDRTRLDGAAMIGPHGNPLIAMTLRYDRLDNFWFTLLHEIAHVCLHVSTGLIDTILDDLEEVREMDFEKEADEFALSALTPEVSWSRCVSRFKPIDRLVEIDAKKIGISPAILAGRLRREKNNYTILDDLVGNGDVRRFFYNEDGEIGHV